MKNEKWDEKLNSQQIILILFPKPKNFYFLNECATVCWINEKAMESFDHLHFSTDYNIADQLNQHNCLWLVDSSRKFQIHLLFNF